MSSDLVPDNDSPVSPGGEQEGEQLRLYLGVLRRRRWWAVGALAFWLVVAAVRVKLTTPIYAAGAKILISSPSSGGASSFLSGAAGALSSLLPSSSLLGGGDIGAEMEIIRSPFTRSLAAEILNAQSSLVRDITAGRLVVQVADDLGEKRRNDLIGLAANASTYKTLGSRSPITLSALNAVAVARSRDSSLVTVSAQSTDPQAASDACNALCLAYLIGKLQEAKTAGESGRKYLGEQIWSGTAAGALDKLEKAERELLEFQSRVGLINGADDISVLVRQAGDLRQKKLDLDGQIRSFRAQLADLQAQLRREGANITAGRSITEMPERTALRQRLAQLYGRRSELLDAYQPTSDEVRAVDRQIADLSRQIQSDDRQYVGQTTEAPNPVYQQLRGAISAASAQLRAAEAQVAPINDALERLEARLRTLPQDGLQYADLQRELQIAQQRYLALRQKQEEIRLMGGQGSPGQLSNLRIIVPASFTGAAAPIRPRPKTDMSLGLMLGLLSAILLVVLVEYWNDTYPDLRALEGDLSWPIVGVLPVAGRSEQVLTLQEGASPSLAEAMQRTFRNLRFSAAGRPLGPLLITSSGAQEGKTTVAINLAHAAVVAGQRVILVDASLREPAVHALLGLRGEPGLSDLLMEQLDPEACLQALPGGTALAELKVLAAGSPFPNPALLFASAAMDHLLEDLRTRADLVVLDGPSLDAPDDARALAAKAGAVLLVVDPARTRRGAARAARTLLTAAGSRVLGLLCNKVNRTGRQG